MKIDGNRTISKTNDPGVNMMRKLHLGNDYIYSHAKKDGTVLSLRQSSLCRTEQVRKLQFQAKHQQSQMFNKIWGKSMLPAYNRIHSGMGK